MSENKIVDAMRHTLSQLENGVHEPEQIVNTLFQSEDRLSKLELKQYTDFLPEYVLENAKSENAVRDFLSMVPVLKDTLLETALKNESVSIEYIQLILEKMKEESLQIACKQESNDLLDMILAKDRALANHQMRNGSYILHYAFQHCITEDIIRTLLWYGAVPDAEDSKGRNILHYAALNPSEEFWKIFIQKPNFSKYLKRTDFAGHFPKELRIQENAT